MTGEAPPVLLRGSSLLLRELRTEDVAAMHEIVGDRRVTDWLSFDARTLQETGEMLESAQKRRLLTPRTEYYVGMQAPDGMLVGFIRLATDGAAAAKVGYAVRHDAWGKGYATEALRLVLAFGFGQLELHRITAAVGPDNRGSLAVLRHVNFVHEGRLREHVFTNGSWRDSLLYSLLRHEWPKAQNPGDDSRPR